MTCLSCRMLLSALRSHSKYQPEYRAVISSKAVWLRQRVDYDACQLCIKLFRHSEFGFDTSVMFVPGPGRLLYC